MVMPDGAKYWRLAYRWFGKQRTLVLGVYPTVSLVDARQARNVAKRDLAKGLDRAAYNSAEWLPRRRRMMQWWADHLDTVAHEDSNVVALARAS